MTTAPSYLIEVAEPGRRTLQVLVSDRLPIGRACDGLLLTDARLSRMHCELRVVGGDLVVADERSSNGTFVDGVRVQGTLVAPVGAVIALGEARVRVLERNGPEPPSAGVAPLPSSVVETAPSLADTIVGRVWEHVGAKPVDALHDSVVGGTLSMAITDIVDSTRLNGELGDRAWFELLRRHDDMVRTITEENGGTEVKGQGDGFLLTFGSARRALCFATELQTQLATRRVTHGMELHVRVGVHTGEVIRNSGDVYGRHVNYAARVAAAAQANEILVSELVQQLTASMGDFTFGPKRFAELKGFAEPQPVYPVVWG